MEPAQKCLVFLGVAMLIIFLLLEAHAQDPVDLNEWTAETYPSGKPYLDGIWTVSPSGYSVLESVNGYPTFFYSDFLAVNTRLKGKIKVETYGDDDYIGFAFGYQPGDPANPNADYLLVDWKQHYQSYNFPLPSCTPGHFTSTGLAVSSVFGMPTADEFWGHVNDDYPCSDLNSGLQELQRGITRSYTGWGHWVEYNFEFEFTPTYLKVYVNGTLEIDIEGSFSDGRIAFYDFSQEKVRYSGFTVSSMLAMDIKPQSCPNPLNVGAQGVLPVALLGTDDLDVMDVDTSTILLEGVAPLRCEFIDEAEPLIREEPCDCWEKGPDGFGDMVIKFDMQKIVAALGDVNDGDVKELTLTAELLDGTEIEASDCAVVVAKAGPQTTERESSAPGDFALLQNSPNPFRGKTTVSFSIAEMAHTTLTIHDLTGRTVMTLLDCELAAGMHSVNCHFDLPAGTYFYRIHAGDFTEMKRMVLLR